MKEDDLPSIGEFDGLFNLCANDHANSGFDDLAVFRTASALPHLTTAERAQVVTKLADLFRREGQTIGAPLLNYPSTPGDKDFQIVDNSIDRSDVGRRVGKPPLSVSKHCGAHSAVTQTTLPNLARNFGRAK